MNVFILNSGRCGSTTFIRACSHITNYSAGHESRAGIVGPDRLRYPANHIEADNRLSWYLGRLDRHYGDGARYVHLLRDRETTAASFARRHEFGIMQAYREGIVLEMEGEPDAMAIARDYLDTVTANIEHFMQNKSHTMTIQLERAEEGFVTFWEWIGAEGDLSAALAEWQVRHNASVE
ncbi:MAG: hypothetical protein OEZ16_07960 [Chromatiales bacterium]|nr:hypothetical protein [Chromatiales bacterium]